MTVNGGSFTLDNFLMKADYPGDVTVSCTVNSTVFGADGQHALSASVQRPDNVSSPNPVYTSLIGSDIRNVYMSVNSKHWSEVKRTIWFDPDSVVQQTGSTVDLWDSSAGGSTARTDPLIVTNPSERPMLVRNSVNGHSQIYFPGVSPRVDNSNRNTVKYLNASWMVFDDPLRYFLTGVREVDTSLRNLNYSLITNVRSDQFGSWSYSTSIGQYGGSTRPDGTIVSGGVGFGMEGSGTQLFALQHTKNGVRVENSASVGSQFLISEIYNKDTPGLILYSNSENIGSNSVSYSMRFRSEPFVPKGSSGSEIAGVTPNDYNFIIGGSVWNGWATSKPADEFWRGMVGDLVWSPDLIQGALLESINTYMAVKFSTIGTPVKAVAASAGYTYTSYDLNLSTNSANLLDDVLLLNESSLGVGRDLVTVAGSDYVNTGAGDDVVTLLDLNFRTIDGSLGLDTVKLSGAGAYVGSNNIILADFVSNADARSGSTTDNQRVDAAGSQNCYG